nr:MAG TPA: hypothetical protein [Caudoviricetes sp.]
MLHNIHKKPFVSHLISMLLHLQFTIKKENLLSSLNSNLLF